METKNLQELLKQLTQERAKAIELKKESNKNFYEDVKEKLKSFIEDFRKEFYPLVEGEQGNIIGHISLDYRIDTYDLLHLEFSGYYKNFKIYANGFMLADCIIFRETIGEEKEINTKDFDKTYLNKIPKSVYKFLLEDKNGFFKKIYNLIEQRILAYNEETLKIMKSL